MSAVAKTLDRVNERVKKEEYYEAHQAVRTVIARYVRKQDYASAVGLLYNSALLFAKAHQTGSASDLLLYMIKIYDVAGVKPDGPSRGRLAEVSWHLDVQDTVLKQVAQKAMAWSHHDPELAHVYGTLFIRGKDIYEAEKYLLQGTRDSATLLADAHIRWCDTEDDPAVRSLILSRGVLGYLSAHDLRNALVYWEAVNQGGVPSNPVIEFLELLTKTCQTRDSHLYRQLTAHYRPAELVPAWQPAMQRIELDFFQIVPPKQFNLMDIMGGMMR